MDPPAGRGPLRDELLGEIETPLSTPLSRPCAARGLGEMRNDIAPALAVEALPCSATVSGR